MLLWGMLLWGITLQSRFVRGAKRSGRGLDIVDGMRQLEKRSSPDSVVLQRLAVEVQRYDQRCEMTESTGLLVQTHPVVQTRLQG